MCADCCAARPKALFLLPLSGPRLFPENTRSNDLSICNHFQLAAIFPHCFLALAARLQYTDIGKTDRQTDTVLFPTIIQHVNIHNKENRA